MVDKTIVITLCLWTSLSVNAQTDWSRPHIRTIKAGQACGERYAFLEEVLLEVPDLIPLVILQVINVPPVLAVSVCLNEWSYVIARYYHAL